MRRAVGGGPADMAEHQRMIPGGMHGIGVAVKGREASFQRRCAIGALAPIEPVEIQPVGREMMGHVLLVGAEDVNAEPVRGGESIMPL